MSEIKFEDLDSPAVPFFARYLEGQDCEDLSEEELSAVGGGTIFLLTKKHPFDKVEVDGGCVTSKFKDSLVNSTAKWPSDHEDSPDYKEPGFATIDIVQILPS